MLYIIIIMYISYNICIIIYCFTWNTATYISKLSNSEDKMTDVSRGTIII